MHDRDEEIHRFERPSIDIVSHSQHRQNCPNFRPTFDFSECLKRWYSDQLSLFKLRLVPAFKSVLIS